MNGMRWTLRRATPRSASSSRDAVLASSPATGQTLRPGGPGCRSFAAIQPPCLLLSNVMPDQPHRLTQWLAGAGSMDSAARVVYLGTGSRIVLDRRGRILAHFGLRDGRRESRRAKLWTLLGDRLRRLLQFWGALLATAFCADVAKLGFVLAWAETTNRLTWPGWLPHEVRVTALVALGIAGAVGMIWFARVAATVLNRGNAAADEDDFNLGPAPNPPRGGGPPPPTRRCGVPRIPRRPGPLAEHAKPSQQTSSQQRALAAR